MAKCFLSSAHVTLTLQLPPELSIIIVIILIYK